MMLWISAWWIILPTIFLLAGIKVCLHIQYDRKPKVSVIIPCYNDGKYIDQAVESVLQQTYQDFEIIIINDGSDEEYTQNFLRHYSKPKTRVIHITHQGPSMARNIGIQKAKGKYILPLDADDKIGNTYLEKGVEILESDSKIGIVYCKAKLFGECEREWNLPKYSFKRMLLQNVIFNSALFKQKDWKKIGGYNTNMKYGLEDYDFWLSLINLGVKVIRIPEVLFFYRIKANSRSLTLHDHYKDMLVQIFYNHQELYAKNIRLLIEMISSLFLSSHLYVDTGDGFNHRESREKEIVISMNRNIQLEFNVSDFTNICSVRFDPVEGRWAKVKIYKIVYEKKNGEHNQIDVNSIGHNGIPQSDGSAVFHTRDPQFFIPIEGEINHIFITAFIQVLDISYIDSIVLELKERIRKQT